MTARPLPSCANACHCCCFLNSVQSNLIHTARGNSVKCLAGQLYEDLCICFSSLSVKAHFLLGLCVLNTFILIPAGSKAEDGVRRAYAPIPKPSTPRHVKTYTERLKELRSNRRYASPIIPRQHVMDSSKFCVCRPHGHHASPSTPMSWIRVSSVCVDLMVTTPVQLPPCCGLGSVLCV